MGKYARNDFHRFNRSAAQPTRTAVPSVRIMHFRFSLNCSRRQRRPKIGRLFSTRRPAPTERRHGVLSIVGDLVLDSVSRVRLGAMLAPTGPPVVASIRHVIATSVYASLILINFGIVRYCRSLQA